MPYVCVRVLKPRNPNSTPFCLCFFVSLHAFALFGFMFISLCFSVCVFVCPSHARLGVSFILLLCHEHAYDMTMN